MVMAREGWFCSNPACKTQLGDSVWGSTDGGTYCSERCSNAGVTPPSCDEAILDAAWKAVCDLSRDKIINSSMDAQAQSLIDSFRESGYSIVPTPQPAADVVEGRPTEADIAAWTIVAEIMRDDPNSFSAYAAAGCARQFLWIVAALATASQGRDGWVDRVAWAQQIVESAQKACAGEPMGRDSVTIRYDALIEAIVTATPPSAAIEAAQAGKL